MSGTVMIIRKAIKEREKIYGPIALFFRQMSVSGHGREILDDPDLMYFYLVNAAPGDKYAFDVMRVRYAVELKLHRRYEQASDAGERCETFAVCVDLLVRALRYSEDEAVRTMLYISELCGGLTDIPERIMSMIRACEAREKREKDELIRKTDRAVDGSIEEMEEAARSCLEGDSILRDWDHAYRLAEKADTLGKSPDARATMGYILYHRPKLSEDKERGLGLLRSAAETGLPRAEYLYGLCLYSEKNNKEGLQWMKRAAEQGEAKAYLTVGVAYLIGRTVPADLNEALKWFRLGEKENDHDCIFHIAASCGYGDLISEKESIKYLKKAARLGNEKAPRVLYNEYLSEYNNICEQDFEKAAEYLYMDAARKKTEAIYKLACIRRERKLPAENEILKSLRYSGGITKEALESILARRWYEEYLLLGGDLDPFDHALFFADTARGLGALEKYAEQEYEALRADDKCDHTYEKKLLAEVFRRCGCDVTNKLNVYALGLYRDLAESGDNEAACILAEMYMNGEGTPAAPEKALKLLRKTAAKKYPAAMLLLADAAERAIPGEKGKKTAGECLRIAEKYCLSVLKNTKQPLCAEVLGRLYEKTDEQKDRAVRYYEKACESSDAAMRCSLMRLTMLYRKTDTQKSSSYLLRCAEAGIPSMMYRAGKMCGLGIGTDTDLVKCNAFRLCAYDMGCADASYDFFLALDCRPGFKHPEKERSTAAVREAELFAKYGGVKKKISLGGRFTAGSDCIVINLDRAERWYGYAAEMRSKKACRKLASLAKICRNPLRALYWHITEDSLPDKAAEKSSAAQGRENNADTCLQTVISGIRENSGSRQPSEKALGILRRIVTLYGDAAPGATGYMLFDALRENELFGFVTDIYIAYACTAADILKREGAEKAAERFAEAVCVSKNKALRVIKYISDACGYGEQISVNDEIHGENRAEQTELIEKLKNSGTDSGIDAISELFLRLGEAGKSDAYYLLGRYYDDESPVSDKEKALRYYSLGAVSGSADCKAFLGKHYLDAGNGFAAAHFIAEAVSEGSELAEYFAELCEYVPNEQMWETAANCLKDRSDEDSRLYLADLYIRHGQYEEYADEAEKIYLSLARGGCVYAWEKLSELYNREEYEDIMVKKAKELYREAAGAGSLLWMTFASLMGEPLSDEYISGCIYSVSSRNVENGDRRYLKYLADMYWQGKIPEKDRERIGKQLKENGAYDDPDTLALLAKNMPDITEEATGKSFLVLAAEKGDPGSMYVLADKAYDRFSEESEAGAISEDNYRKAVMWFGRAARHRHLVSMWHLAQLYTERPYFYGQSDHARYWAEQAGEKGYIGAYNLAEKLRSKEGFSEKAPEKRDKGQKE